MAPRRRRGTRNITVRSVPIFPLPSELETFGEGEWEVDAVVGEHRLFCGRTYFQIAWNGWQDQNGNNKTWEDDTIFDDENKHFLESWKQSEEYQRIREKALIDPFEVAVTLPRLTGNEQYDLEERWKAHLREEGRDSDEELPFHPDAFFTATHNRYHKEGSLQKIANYRTGVVQEEQPQRRAWRIQPSRKPDLGRWVERRNEAQSTAGPREQLPSFPRRRARPVTPSNPSSNDESEDDSQIHFRYRPSGDANATPGASGTQWTKPQVVRKRTRPRRTSRSSGTPSTNINLFGHESDRSEQGGVKNEPTDDSVWYGIGQHTATLVITDSDSSDEVFDLPEVSPDPPAPMELDLIPKTIEDYSREWNAEATRIGAAEIVLVNDVDDETPIPPGVPFKYLENEYLYCDTFPKDLQLSSIKEYLTACNHTGPCTAANGCTCRSHDHQALDVYNEKGVVTLDLPEQNDGITECNINCSCQGETFIVTDAPTSQKGKGRETSRAYHCWNRVAQSPRTYPLIIFKTNNGRGWGVRCMTAIPKGAVLGIYTGKIMEETDPIVCNEPGSNYSFDLDMRKHLDNEMRRDDGDEDEDEAQYVIEGYNHGNWTRFVNHSCEPVARTISIIYDTLPLDSPGSVPKLAYITTRALEAGTEITIDYNPAYNLNSEAFKKGKVRWLCRCGTESCRGAIL